MSGADRRVVLLGGAALAAAGPALGQTGGETERLNAFFEAVFERRAARSPSLQARLGLGGPQWGWDDVSDARAVEDAALVRGDLERLAEFDRDRLTPAARLSADVFAHDARDDLLRFRWRHHHYPVCQMRGPQRAIPHGLINNHPIASREDAQAYVARLHAVGPHLDQVIAGLAQQEAMGIRPPDFALPMVITNCENLLRGAPFGGDGDSPILADFREKVAAAELASAEGLLREAEAGLREGFGPGFRRLIGWLGAAAARGSHRSGVGALPDGEAYYAAMLESHTTLPVDAAQVHALGLSEVARIQAEMAGLQARIGFSGDLPAFFAHLRNEPQFYYPDTEAGRAAYLSESAAVIEEVEGRLGELMTLRPSGEMVIRRVEPWLEGSAGIAGYFAGSPDGQRPGILYYNLRDMGNLPRFELSALAYHEGVPGHHLEKAVTQQLGDLPRFRRHGGYTAYSEGWALYAEQLPREIGLYQDPLQDFGRLSSELMRAGRLVVDTGLHAFGWSEARALAWLEHNTPNSAADNLGAVRRYLVTPGQATAYAMGRLKVLELRERARSELGGRYRLQDFNDVVLGGGPLPLPVLEQVVEAWIAS